MASLPAFTAICRGCGIEREFEYTLIDYIPNGHRIAHGVCTVCQTKIMKDTGESIWMRASCPECKVEISIYTFDGEKPDPLNGCGECGYLGRLIVLEMTKGNQRLL
jgi:hypothetical protein